MPILFHHHCIRDSMRLHHACVHHCFHYASSVTRFCASGAKMCVFSTLFFSNFSIRYIQDCLGMSSSDGETQETTDNPGFSQETAIGALAGILQGIQTTLADLSTLPKAQTAAFQCIQEDILLATTTMKMIQQTAQLTQLVLSRLCST